MKNKEILYSELLNIFLKQSEKTVKESSLSTFSYLIEKHIRPALGDIPVNDFSSETVQNFIFNMMEKEKSKGRGKFAIKSIKDVVTLIKVSINFGIRMGIMENITLKYKIPFKINRKKIEIFNIMEQKIYREYYYNILKKLNIKKLSYHSLRHAFATSAIENGTDYKTVSEILGHSSINITLETYVHPQMKQKKKCIENMFNALKKQ